MENDIKYLDLMFKRLWLIVLAAAITGGLAYAFRDQQEPVYTATATVYVGNALDLDNPGTGLFESAQQLAGNYSILVRQRPALEDIIDTLDLDMSTDTLRSIIGTGLIPETSFLEISVSYNDPELAAEIANAAADWLITNNPGNPTIEEEETLTSVEVTINELEERIEELNVDLDRVEQQREDELQRRAPDQAQLDQLNERYNDLFARINEAEANLNAFQQRRLELSGNINRIVIAEPAVVPGSPGGISPIIVGSMGAIVGMIFAIAVVLFFEYLDNTIRNEEEATRVLGLSVLGVIERSRRIAADYENYEASRALPRAQVSEGYRTVQTNLLFSASKGASKMFIMASPGVGEGRTATVANLAVIAAEAGVKVLLIDADLRRPRLHKAFGLENNTGIVKMLELASNDPELLETSGQYTNILDEAVQDTRIPSLKVITSGMNGGALSAQALSFDNLRRWIEIIQTTLDFDVIMFDTSPSTSTADSYILAATTKANVILLIEAGRTRSAAALKAKDQFEHVGSNISGVILNKA